MTGGDLNAGIGFTPQSMGIAHTLIAYARSRSRRSRSACIKKAQMIVRVPSVPEFGFFV